MTTRRVNFLILAALALIAGAYLFRSFHIATEALTSNYEPIHFPVALGIALLALCGFEYIREMRSRTAEFDAPFELPNAGKLLATIVLIALYFIAWRTFELFYAATALFFFALLMVFRGRIERRFVLLAVALSIGFAAAIFLVFQVIFGMRLA